MEIEIDDKIIYLDNALDYPFLDSSIMDVIIFDMYRNLIYNRDKMLSVYSKEEIDKFYRFLHMYCNNINKFKRSKAKLSQLLCLSYMMTNDKNLKKNNVEFLFNKRIQSHFKNWFSFKKIKKKSGVNLFICYIKNMFSKTYKENFKKVNKEIQKYIQFGRRIPDTLLLYDKGNKIKLKNHVNRF
jgi:hypothetical protein